MATKLQRKIEVLKDVELAQKVHLTEGFENFIPHMYLDTTGNVTVGIGHLLKDAAAACDVLFQKDGKRATTEEIKAEFKLVSDFATAQRAQEDNKKKMRAKDFSGKTKLRITDESAYGLAAQDIAVKERELRKEFPDFDKYPHEVKEALLDMAFNLGVTGVVVKFPSFTKAIHAGNWRKAAEESRRPQLGVSRNKATRERLEKAPLPKRLAPQRPQKLP